MLNGVDLILGVDWMHEHDAVLKVKHGVCTLFQALGESGKPVNLFALQPKHLPGFAAVAAMKEQWESAAEIKLLSPGQAVRQLRKGCSSWLMLVKPGDAGDQEGWHQGSLAAVVAGCSEQNTKAEQDPELVPQAVLDGLLSEYADVFGDMPPGLPPNRPVGHTIRTPPGAEAPYKRMYKLSPREEAEVKKQLAELLAKGLIEPSSSPYGAPILGPDDAALRKKVIHTMHDTRSAGHLGMTKTLEQVTRWFTWPGVSEDVKNYVRSCHSCQVNKSSAKKPAGLLQPLPIPERPWDSVSMDLIVKLPASGPNKYDSILVFVDRLTKMVHLVKTWESMTATQYAKLFLEHVFRLHGMPRSVVSDRGPQFHNKFWTEVTKLLQVQVNLSSAYHPETDGQTERVNRVIEEMLRHFIRPDQRDWAEYLPLVEFAINNAWQESVRSTPFYLNYGYHPRLAELLDLPQKVPQAHDFVKGMKTAVEQARQCLARAQKRMKSYQDNKRREALYLPGDMVLLSTQNMRGKANQPGVRKLKPRYVGPFSVQYMVGKAAVKLWLPDEWSRLHNVFHVSLVKPYRTDASGAVPGLAGPPPVQWLDGEPQYTVEKVVGHRLEPSKGKRKGKCKKRRLEFLVKWQGHGDEHNTWELSTQLVGCQELLARYLTELVG
ncbi:hypothetical protein QJQ45_020535 [Haematococcus lacustris]|nr:hypothetical protein QJQ45_020535 [Haematococcus lacustris]